MKTEIWKNIEGYEGLYEISSLGRVKTLPHYVKNKNGYRLVKERILKPHLSVGYLYARLGKNGGNLRIHRLVAEAFIPNPHNYPQVNHINEDKTDNRACNLEWCTNQYNLNYGAHNTRMAKSLSIPVIQRDMDNNFIKEWESSHQVERELGIWHTHINDCCKGTRNSAGGFKWKYAKKAEK